MSQPQPKFKMWQKVKSRDDVFIITGIESGAEGYSYWGDENSFIVMESGLTEVKEPLKVEFEGKLRRDTDNILCIPTPQLFEFEKKRLLITVEEIP